MKFEWQTEESEGWDEPAAALEPLLAQDEPLAAGRGWPVIGRRGRLALGMAAGLLLVITFLCLLLQWQSKNVETTISDDLHNSHTLIWQAALEKDVELFQVLRADEVDPTWARNQDELLAAGLFLDRRPFGLALQVAEPELDALHLSPDLATAKLSFVQRYVITATDGTTATVGLLFTHFYDHSRESWRLIPPDDDYWGVWQTREGQLLTLVYSEREAAVAGRLAQDLDDLLVQLCADLETVAFELNCPLGWHIRLLLSRDLPSLVHMVKTSNPASTLLVQAGERELRLYLPSSALMGLPLDEAGYQALYRIYAFHLVKGLLQNRRLTGNPALLDFDASQPALVTRLLIGLGLRPWPAGRPANSPGPLPFPWPEQDVALLCVGERGQETLLHRYDPGRQRWSVKEALPVFNDLEAVLGGEAILLRLLPPPWPAGTEEDGPMPLFLLPDGRPLNLPAVISLNEHSASRLEPHGQYLVTSGFNPEQDGPPGYQALNLARCLQARCRWQPLPAGEPQWSPDQAHVIVSNHWNKSLYLGSVNEWSFVLVGEEGMDPFWLDNEIYGYFRWIDANTGEVWQGRGPGWVSNSEAVMQLVLATIHDSIPRPLLTFADLMAVLPAGEQLAALDGPVRVFPSPAGSGRLLLGVYGRPPYDPFPFASTERPYLFEVNLENNEISLVSQENQVDIHTVNGRFAAGTVEAEGQVAQIFFWQDLASGEMSTLAYYNPYNIKVASLRPVAEGHDLAWSADGRWLLILVDGVLIFVAPEYDYRQIIVPPSPGCFAAAWVSK